MNRLEPTRKAVINAACAGDLDQLRKLAGLGVDLDDIGQTGESLLEAIIFDLCVDEKKHRYEVVRLLLASGADPNARGAAKSTPLLPAMLRMDVEMLQILLEAGADPNLPGGCSESSSFYDWAEFHYRYSVYGLKLPEEPSGEVRNDEDAWLDFLDGLALRQGARRPNHLFLLRRYGAKSMNEMRR